MRKLGNARTHCRVPESEVVLGLVDCTVFGSARHAAVFTDRGIYIHARWTADCELGVLALPYDQLQRLDLIPAYAFPLIRDRIDPVTRSALAAMRVAIHHHQVATAVEASQAAVAARPVEVVSGELGIAREVPADSPEAAALQDAIRAEPEDAGPQLVLADLLLADDDPRGELIVLHQRELTEGLHDPVALERYLVLAAYYSFPRAQPEDPTLPFVSTRASAPVRFVLSHGADYELVYHQHNLRILINGRHVMRRRLKLAHRDAWTATETGIILRHISEAIRAGAPLVGLQLPFVANPLPTYGGGPVRSYRLPAEFTRPRGLGPNELGLAARDYHRWIDLWRRLARAMRAA